MNYITYNSLYLHSEFILILYPDNAHISIHDIKPTTHFVCDHLEQLLIWTNGWTSEYYHYIIPILIAISVRIIRIYINIILFIFYIYK